MATPSVSRFLDGLFAGKPEWFVALICLLILAVTALVDYATGTEISFFIFFGIPLVLSSWYGSTRLGYLFCILAIISWMLVDVLNRHFYSQHWIFYWNSGVRLAFFLLVAYWTSSIRSLLEQQYQLARIDGLTGCLNSAAFNERCEFVFSMTQRFGQPVTLSFIDLDDFKRINDDYGHSEGDRILRQVAETMLSAVRRTDVVGRMGGDEFAILLPDTKLVDARIVFENLRHKLAQINCGDRTIGLSIGVVEFAGGHMTADHAIAWADALMYRVKKDGKGGIQYEAAGPVAAT